MPTVLAIAHGFPPASGSGPNRALAFARYLPEHGWRPIVLTPGVAWAMHRDDRLLAEVPADLTVIRTRSFERQWMRGGVTLPVTLGVTPGAYAGGGGRGLVGQRGRAVVSGQWSVASGQWSLSWLRRQAGHLRRFPDAHLGWLPFAVAAGLRVPADVLYSSSGPFTSHLVGLVLHRLSRRPWVAELRDGWYRWNRAIFPDYPAWRDTVERRLEAAVIRSAARVVLVTERMAQAFRCQYPDLPAAHFAVVPNGFDPAQLTIGGAQHLATSGAVDRFEVLHAGALYYGRGLTGFLEAATRLVEADASFARAFRLTLVGTLDATARAELAHHRLGDRVAYRGYLDHPATLAAMRSADLLLLVANTTPGAEATVPGKLFEYFAVGRPVLAIAPPDSASSDLLHATGGGWLAPAGDVEVILDQLRAAFTAHQRGELPRPDPTVLARYDRRRLTAELARIFDDVLSAAP